MVGDRSCGSAHRAAFSGRGGGGDREGSSKEQVSSKPGSRQTCGAAGWTECSDDPLVHSFVVRQVRKKAQSYVKTVCAEGGMHEDLLTAVHSRWGGKNQELGVSGAQMLSGEQGQAFFFFFLINDV